MLILVMAVLGAGPEAMRAGEALEVLGKYGEVPECRPNEQIRKDDHSYGGHSHEFSPPQPLPALKGKAKELIAFTHHADRRVVLRAARLLCFEGGPASKEVLESLAARWPCEQELVTAAYAFGTSTRHTCDARYRGDEVALFAPAAELAKWSEGPDLKLLAALKAQDPAAWNEVAASLTFIDGARERTVVKTVAALDDAAAIRRLLALGSAAAPQHRASTVQLFDNAAKLALGAMAKKQGLELPPAFLELLRGASPGEIKALGELNLSYHDLLTGQAPAARALFQKAGTTPAGRGLLELVVEHSAEVRKSYFDRRRQVDEWERNRDRPALRAFLKDEASLHVDRRHAARALARLGDKTGLALWASSAGLTENEYQARKSDLNALLANCQGEVNAEAQKLLAAQWSR
jgi:hypothetical protein